MLVAVLLGGLTTVAVVRAAQEPGCLGEVGINWPGASRVYVAGQAEQSTTVDDPDRVFTVAAEHGLRQVRVLVGVDSTFAVWNADPAKAVRGVQRLVDDAAARGLQLVLSTYPDRQMIEALAGRGYPSWEAAQRDLTTPDSVPWRRLDAWLRDVVPPLATHPNVAAWEVVNEPGYMLGMDSGAVDTDGGLFFFEHFARLLKELGARSVNGGGRPVYDPSTLTDEQLAGYVEQLDVLDDHLYERHARTGTAPPGSEAQGRDAVEASAQWFARAREVADRPGMPAMLGEVGSQPGPWFAGVVAAATERGWPLFAWGFDAYDENGFNDEANPETLRALAAAAERARERNGELAVVVGTPLCRPQDDGS